MYDGTIAVLRDALGSLNVAMNQQTQESSRTRRHPNLEGRNFKCPVSDRVSSYHMGCSTSCRLDSALTLCILAVINQTEGILWGKIAFALSHAHPFLMNLGTPPVPQ